MERAATDSGMDSKSDAVNLETDEAEKHKEGKIALTIEQQTAKLPSDLFLFAAFASIAASAAFQATGRKDTANFIGHWAPTFLVLGLYNKIVKVLGSDRVGSHVEANENDPADRLASKLGGALH